MARQPPSDREAVRPAGRIAIERVIDLVIDPPVVPPPALELPRIAVLDPADFPASAVHDLMLELSTPARPERHVAQHVVERVDGLDRDGVERGSRAGLR